MKKPLLNILLLIAAWAPFTSFANMDWASPLPFHFFTNESNEMVGRVDLRNRYNEGVAYCELPNTLSEVSGIEYLGNNRFACIQENVGTIYIYNAEANKIEKEIPFSGAGDFEGIAIAGSAAYVVESSGKLYEILNYEGSKPVIYQYATPLTAKHNVEGLAYDKKNNCLLLAIKGAEPRNTRYKGVYAFDLKSKRLESKPTIKINLNDPFFNTLKEKNKSSVFQPSAIEIHPVTKDIYILQGTEPKLLVMDAKGAIKKLYTFSRKELPNAKGLSFSPKGELFISNEGTNAAASIVKVTL